MQETMVMPIDMKVLMNHIYEFKKGVRQMILFTFNKNTRLSRWNDSNGRTLIISYSP